MSTVTMIGTLASDGGAQQAISLMSQMHFGELRSLQANHPLAVCASAVADGSRPDMTWYVASLAGDVDLDRIYSISAEIRSSGFAELVSLIETDAELPEVAMLFLDLSSCTIARTHEFDNIRAMLAAIGERVSAGAPLDSELYVYRRRGRA